MNFEVRSVSPADFDAYISARESGLSTYDALESIGQPGNATSTTPFQLSRQQQSSASADD
jgi:cytochrome c oxidase subunit 2